MKKISRNVIAAVAALLIVISLLPAPASAYAPSGQDIQLLTVEVIAFHDGRPINPEFVGTFTKTGIVPKGEKFTLEAEANKGYIFTGWTIEGTVHPESPYEFYPENDMAVYATFIRDPDYVEITVRTYPWDGGTVTGGGFYLKGEDVTLSASPMENYKFDYWLKGEDNVSSDAEYSFKADNDRILNAYFRKTDEYLVSFTDGEGTILDQGYVKNGKTPVFSGEEPQKPADDNYYYVFSGWDPEIQAVISDQTYMAVFTRYDKYVLTEGAGGQYTTGSGTPLEFVFQPAAGDDPKAIDHFTGASVDGIALAEGTDFTVKVGSVVLELLPEYMESLSAGKHTLTVSFDDRFEAETDISIVVPPPSNPKTGVGSNMLLYAGILIFAALAAFGIIAIRRKKAR